MLLSKKGLSSEEGVGRIVGPGIRQTIAIRPASSQRTTSNVCMIPVQKHALPRLLYHYCMPASGVVAETSYRIAHDHFRIFSRI